MPRHAIPGYDHANRATAQIVHEALRAHAIVTGAPVPPGWSSLNQERADALEGKVALIRSNPHAVNTDEEADRIMVAIVCARSAHRQFGAAA